MEERYKIGDISKLFGIPAQTLRFYEEKGILTPYRDETDGYRYYNAWDVNYLLDTMYLRSLEFPLPDTESILNELSVAEICDKYMEQESLILHKIEHYRKVLDILTAHRQRIQGIDSRLGRHVFCRSREMIFHRHRLRYSFQSLTGADLKNLKKELTRWTELIMECQPTFLIPLDGLKQNKADASYWWGWSMSPALAVEKEIKPVLPNEYLPSVDSICTIFAAGEKGSFMKAFYEQVYTKILEEGYRITGSPYGRLIIKEHAEERFQRYFEVWVPVERMPETM